MENLIVKMRFGSHVYGTNLPTSDTDIKGVFLPHSDDILLQTAKGSSTSSTKEDKTAKNTADDVDVELFSLHKYVRLLLEGQTVALDMLFTGEEFYEIEPHPVWKFLQRNRHKFLHSGAASFAGYCREQANKYGIKGSRVAAVRSTVEFLRSQAEKHPNKLQGRLREVWAEVEGFVEGKEHILITPRRGPDGQEVPHLECCNRLTAIHNTFKQCLEVYERILENYGNRALMAESNQGVDWKALSHAVRVCEEAKELLSTGKVTFPRPEKELLLKIRKGELAYKQVAEMIEQGLNELESYSARSTLPKEPDYEFANKFIALAYANVVISSYGREFPFLETSQLS